MASKKKADKKAKNKGDKKKSAEKNLAPRIIESKVRLAPGALLAKTLETMEDELRISKKAAVDFVDSLISVVEGEINEGHAVNLFHLAKLVPRLHTKGERMVNSEFGNSESPKVKKVYKAKVTLAPKRGTKVAGKAGAAILPNVAKMQKAVGG